MDLQYLDDTNDGDFYAVGRSGMSPKVVLTVQAFQQRVGLALTPTQARQLARWLMTEAETIDGRRAAG